MIYGLREEELKRIDKSALSQLIEERKKHLNTWSLPEHMKEEIREEIRQLEEILNSIPT